MTAERFAAGLTFAAYVDGMAKNQAEMAAGFTGYTLPPEAHAALQTLAGPVRVLAITEDWCSDSRLYLPVFARMAADAGWPLHVFVRTAHPDLAADFAAQGLPDNIPTVVLYDADWQEIGHWIERPALANAERQVVIDTLAQTHPAVVAGRPNAAQPPAAREITDLALRALRDERTPAWQAAALAEVLGLLHVVAATP
jgi:hypothetical protein